MRDPLVEMELLSHPATLRSRGNRVERVCYSRRTFQAVPNPSPTERSQSRSRSGAPCVPPRRQLCYLAPIGS
jgi:hypothetical protein